MVYFELSPTTQSILDFISAPIIYFGILPAATVYHTVLYLVRGPPFPRWTFGHYMRLNQRRVVYGAYAWLRLPRRDVEEDQVPRDAEKYLKDCDVEQVVCAPLSEKEGNWPKVLSQGKPYVKPKKVPGWWIHQRDSDDTRDLTQRAAPNERIVFFIVGGGYVGGHPLRIHTAWSIAKLTGARVFCVNYRKSLSAEMAFPASLLDCMAGYQYLIADRGFDPRNIMLCGDSAGANASLALARCLNELEATGSKRLGQVGSMCLHSPWADMTSSFPTIKSNRYTDHLIDLTTVHIPSHTRHFQSKANPYFSPALTPEGGFSYLAKSGTKVYISAGTAEAFYDEIIALYKTMKRDGVDVQLRELEGATHSDFVWLDRNESKTLGWTWEIIKNDFQAFWHNTT